MSKKNIHTVYNKDREMWETKKEGQVKPLASSRTKATAEEKSIREAKRLRSNTLFTIRTERLATRIVTEKILIHQKIQSIKIL
jgi:hypothetical protein